MDKITHEVRLANWISLVEQCQSRPVGKRPFTFLCFLQAFFVNFFFRCMTLAFEKSLYFVSVRIG